MWQGKISREARRFPLQNVHFWRKIPLESLLESMVRIATEIASPGARRIRKKATQRLKKAGQELARNRPGTGQELAKSWPETGQKSARNGPKSIKKWSKMEGGQNRRWKTFISTTVLTLKTMIFRALWGGVHGFRDFPGSWKIDPILARNWPKTGQKLARNRPETGQKLARNRPKAGQKLVQRWSQNESKNDQNECQISSKMGKKQEVCIAACVRGPWSFCGRTTRSVRLVLNVFISRCGVFRGGRWHFSVSMCAFCWFSVASFRWGCCGVGF